MYRGADGVATVEGGGQSLRTALRTIILKKYIPKTILEIPNQSSVSQSEASLP